jgi:hypothetical protein
MCLEELQYVESILSTVNFDETSPQIKYFYKNLISKLKCEVTLWISMTKKKKIKKKN